jgi:hypothetical protein
MELPQYKIHENLPSSSEVIWGDTPSDKQTGYLKSMLSFLESRVKTVLLYLSL